MWISPNIFYRRGSIARTFLALLLAWSGPALQAQTVWSTVGPAGGDARSFAAVPGQPNHLYLGTANSWIYESADEGSTWHRLAKLGSDDGLVLAHIVVDSAHSTTIYVAGWRADRNDGGLWISQDSGRNWIENEGLHGQKILSFAQAPSDPMTLVAGTLEGIFRSNDAGASWSRISPDTPPLSGEIHEVESLAIDPVDPNIIYAGTWHLPWKTSDGGATWHNIKNGLIEDSDVFSIIVDPVQPKTVFLSACSGIYKSVNAGEKFRKIQGIPSTARRTRVIRQDPENLEVVYAGTTEGLYKTVDGGRTFQAMTGDDVIVNDVYVDPQDSSRVLLATDRGGVLVSKDAGVTFTVSNEGISGRKVEALLVDRADPTLLYAGVVNDKSYGGVFVSTNGGAAWEQIGEGLDGRDIFALAQARDGTILAGTSHGIFALSTGNHPNDNDPVPASNSNDPPQISEQKPHAADSAVAGTASWLSRNSIVNTIVKASTQTFRGTRVNVEKRVKAASIELDSRVNSLDISSDIWLASTGVGLLTSKDQGATWQGGPVMGSTDFLSVTVHGDTMVAARTDGVVLSTDAGQFWMPMGIPTMLTRIHRVTFSKDGTLWLGAREGVYFTHDLGKTWLWIQRLPFRDVDDLTYDDRLGKILVSSQTSDQVYAIDPKTQKWQLWQTGYRIALIRAAGNRLVAASLSDGVLVEPRTAGLEIGQK